MKIIIYSSCTFLLGTFLGILIFRNNWFPISMYREVFNQSPKYFPPYGIFYTSYTSGTPLFSDRSYHDIIGNEELENSYVIQLPRHYPYDIKIEIDNKTTVYRILSEKNDNSFLKDWELTNITVNVKGESCSHTQVVKKVFNKGKVIELLNGGLVASTPIIIKSFSKTLPSFLKINNAIINDKYGLKSCNINKN